MYHFDMCFLFIVILLQCMLIFWCWLRFFASCYVLFFRVVVGAQKRTNWGIRNCVSRIIFHHLNVMVTSLAKDTKKVTSAHRLSKLVYLRINTKKRKATMECCPLHRIFGSLICSNQYGLNNRLTNLLSSTWE